MSVLSHSNEVGAVTSKLHSIGDASQSRSSAVVSLAVSRPTNYNDFANFAGAAVDDRHCAIDGIPVFSVTSYAEVMSQILKRDVEAVHHSVGLVFRDG